MKVITNEKMGSKRVVFEPGNCTRYDLLLTKIPNHSYVITDLTNRRTVLVNPDFFSVDSLEIDLVEAGYSLGDAEPMAKFLEDALNENAYIKYESRGATYIRWFKNTEQSWDCELEDISDRLMEMGGEIVERGVIWDY